MIAEKQADQQAVETETRMYMYDMQNAAKEHGFKGEDGWELSMATNTERIKIQKDYFPTVAVKIGPEILLQVFHTIKMRLNQPIPNVEPKPANDRFTTAPVEDTSYLVAYNPKRPRT